MPPLLSLGAECLIKLACDCCHLDALHRPSAYTLIASLQAILTDTAIEGRAIADDEHAQYIRHRRNQMIVFARAAERGASLLASSRVPTTPDATRSLLAGLVLGGIAVKGSANSGLLPPTKQTSTDQKEVAAAWAQQLELARSQMLSAIEQADDRLKKAQSAPLTPPAETAQGLALADGATASATDVAAEGVAPPTQIALYPLYSTLVNKPELNPPKYSASNTSGRNASVVELASIIAGMDASQLQCAEELT